MHSKRGNVYEKRGGCIQTGNFVLKMMNFAARELQPLVLKMMNVLLKLMKFVLKLMKFVLTMMKFVLTMMNFVLKMIQPASLTPRPWAARAALLPPRLRPRADLPVARCRCDLMNFCIKNEKFCITNEEFCIKSDEFCIQNDGLCIQNDAFCIQIQCGATTSVSNGTPDYRLSDYPQGRIEVFKDGEWGTVCGHWFWDSNDGANIACKKVGYAGGTVYTAGSIIPATDDR